MYQLSNWKAIYIDNTGVCVDLPIHCSLPAWYAEEEGWLGLRV